MSGSPAAPGAAHAHENLSLSQPDFQGTDAARDDHMNARSTSGLAQGGLGGPEDQLLEDGQEEVFSRAEIESGRIEHHANTQTAPDPGEIEPSSPNSDQSLTAPADARAKDKARGAAA